MEGEMNEDQIEIIQLVENDLSLALKGFKFGNGDLDWYLDKKLPIVYKLRIQKIKKRLDI